MRKLKSVIRNHIIDAFLKHEKPCQNHDVLFRVLFGLNICKSAIFFVPLQQQINRKPSTLPITRKEDSTVSGAGCASNRSEMLKIAVKSDVRVLTKQSINFKKER